MSSFIWIIEKELIYCVYFTNNLTLYNCKNLAKLNIYNYSIIMIHILNISYYECYFDRQ